jgi:hypothetical protein
LITLIAAYYLFDSLFPQWRPKWMRPFVVEHAGKGFELPAKNDKQSLRWVVGLSLAVILGFSADVVRLISSETHLTDAIQLISWVSVLPCRVCATHRR